MVFTTSSMATSMNTCALALCCLQRQHPRTAAAAAVRCFARGRDSWVAGLALPRMAGMHAVRRLARHCTDISSKAGQAGACGRRGRKRSAVNEPRGRRRAAVSQTQRCLRALSQRCKVHPRLRGTPLKPRRCALTSTAWRRLAGESLRREQLLPGGVGASFLARSTRGLAPRAALGLNTGATASGRCRAAQVEEDAMSDQPGKARRSCRHMHIHAWSDGIAATATGNLAAFSLLAQQLQLQQHRSGKISAGGSAHEVRLECCSEAPAARCSLAVAASGGPLLRRCCKDGSCLHRTTPHVLLALSILQGALHLTPRMWQRRRRCADEAAVPSMEAGAPHELVGNLHAKPVGLSLSVSSPLLLAARPPRGGGWPLPPPPPRKSGLPVFRAL